MTPTSRSTEGPGPAVLGVHHSRVAVAMPRGACDCHVHVFGAAGQYTFAENRTFMPSPATVDDLVAFQSALDVDRAVIVQASPQGTDTRCLTDTLAALRQRGRQARGVAVVSPQATAAELRALHTEGVRGLRVNLQSFGITAPALAAEALRQSAQQARGMGWHVQIYAQLTVIAALADTLADLGVPVAVDHFGLAHASGGLAQKGFPELLALVKAGNVWVKLSAPYRITDHPQGDDGVSIARALIDAHPDHMLWGTDWPHTNPLPGVPRLRDRPDPLRPIDDGAQFNVFARWTSAHERQRILVDNPARLYDFAPADAGRGAP